MATQVSRLWHSFNTPYQRQNEHHLYDFSDGGCYSFTQDAKNWAISFGINFLFISKVLPYIGVVNPLPLTLTEGIAILSVSTAVTALIKRVIGFAPSKEENEFVEKTLVDWIAFAGYVVVALYAIPQITHISYERILALVIKTIWPPIIVPMYQESTRSMNTETQIAKIQKIYKDYTRHHVHVMELSHKRQKQVYNGMYALHLEPPKEVVQSHPQILEEMELYKSIFFRIEPTNPIAWIRTKASNFLQTFGFHPIASIEDINKKMINDNLSSLDLKQFQWLILNLSQAKEVTIERSDFDKLKEKVLEINDPDSTGLIEKLKTATSLEHLRTLVLS